MKMISIIYAGYGSIYTNIKSYKTQ